MIKIVFAVNKFILTSSTNRQPVVVQIRQDFLGQIMAEGQLGSIGINGWPPATPESFQTGSWWVLDKRYKTYFAATISAKNYRKDLVLK